MVEIIERIVSRISSAANADPMAFAIILVIVIGACAMAYICGKE